MGTIRVVIAKPGLDGHDRGAKVVARALRDAGVEVIYTGLHQTPEQIVAAAIQEDADAIGLSILSGAHMTQFTRVLELLAERGASDIVVFGGGIVPEADITELERLGVAKIFTPGASTYDIVEWVESRLGEAGHGGYRAAGQLILNRWWPRGGLLALGRWWPRGGLLSLSRWWPRGGLLALGRWWPRGGLLALGRWWPRGGLLSLSRWWPGGLLPKPVVATRRDPALPPRAP